MSTNRRNDENEDDNESSSNLSNDSQPEEEEKVWEIENIFNFDMSTCSIPNVRTTRLCFKLRPHISERGFL